jgi:hypothetical protein
MLYRLTSDVMVVFSSRIESRLSVCSRVASQYSCSKEMCEKDESSFIISVIVFRNSEQTYRLL